MVLAATEHEALSQAADLASSGARVLVLARTSAALHGENLPGGVRPVAFVLCTEQVRPDAATTIAYFAAQGVSLKVISGDSPRTVGAVAGRVAVAGADHPVDARELPSRSDELARVLEDRSVFGRVTPEQKQAIVTTLRGRGHTVAMTGDGVNDALALKLADVGIAMGSGAPATKAVAELVLLDNNFATLPGVVAEGRRVTANIERVANIFITKTVWSTLLAIAVGIALIPYPFLPRHLTIVDVLTIGVPSFFLALAPNLRRYVPGFIDRVLAFTVPAGIIVAATTVSAYLVVRTAGVPLVQQRTAATVVVLMLSLAVLLLLALPVTWPKLLLVVAALAGFLVLFALRPLRTFYSLDVPAGELGTAVLIGALGVAVLASFWLVSRHMRRAPAGVVRQPVAVAPEVERRAQ
jgi:cation-transporting ATPase E